MSPEQQRAIDALITAGKLDPAADMYRALTGTALIGAKMYVYDRASALQSGAPSGAQAAVPAPAPARASAPRPAPRAAPGIVDPRRAPQPAARPKAKGGCGGLVFWIVVIAVLFNVGKAAIRTRGFGAFTIVRAPYYRELVRAIEVQPKFRAQLGKPIGVDDDGVWCTQVSSSSGGDDSSDCRLPVRGSRTPAGDGAYVEAQSERSARTFRSVLTLHVRNTEYAAVYDRRK